MFKFILTIFSQQDLENFKAEVEKRSETLDLVKPSTEQQECTSWVFPKHVVSLSNAFSGLSIAVRQLK